MQKVFFLTQRIKPFMKERGERDAGAGPSPQDLPLRERQDECGCDPGFKVGFLCLGEEDNASEPSYF